MQYSQRVHDAKPRTAVARGHGNGVESQAAHRGGEPPRAMARRRDGDIAPYRNGARGVYAARGHGRCACEGVRGVCAARGRAAGRGKKRLTK